MNGSLILSRRDTLDNINLSRQYKLGIDDNKNLSIGDFGNGNQVWNNTHINMNSSGNIGIGITANPSNKLYVNGATTINNSLTTTGNITAGADINVSGNIINKGYTQPLIYCYEVLLSIYNSTNWEMTTKGTNCRLHICGGLNHYDYMLLGTGLSPNTNNGSWTYMLASNGIYYLTITTGSVAGNWKLTIPQQYDLNTKLSIMEVWY